VPAPAVPGHLLHHLHRRLRGSRVRRRQWPGGITAATACAIHPALDRAVPADQAVLGAMQPAR